METRGKMLCIPELPDDYDFEKTYAAVIAWCQKELPYEGAKEMLLVDEVDNREFMCNLLRAMYDELPAPKKNLNNNEGVR